MPRAYTKIQGIKEEILKMYAEGKTQREIAEHFGFTNKYIVKEYLKRERRKERAQSYGILPRRRGRPPKGDPRTG